MCYLSRTRRWWTESSLPSHPLQKKWSPGTTDLESTRPRGDPGDGTVKSMGVVLVPPLPEKWEKDVYSFDFESLLSSDGVRLGHPATRTDTVSSPPTRSSYHGLVGPHRGSTSGPGWTNKYPYPPPVEDPVGTEITGRWGHDSPLEGRSLRRRTGWVDLKEVHRLTESDVVEGGTFTLTLSDSTRVNGRPRTTGSQVPSRNHRGTTTTRQLSTKEEEVFFFRNSRVEGRLGGVMGQGLPWVSVQVGPNLDGGCGDMTGGVKTEAEGHTTLPRVVCPPLKNLLHRDLDSDSPPTLIWCTSSPFP